MIFLKNSNFNTRFFNKNICKSQRYKGFTLAEVLITLVIIGIIAAMTIPTLVSNYHKDQTVTQLKKAYSDVSQAVKLSSVENGNPTSWDWPASDSTDELTTFVETYIIPYLLISRNCGKAIDPSACTVKTRKYMAGNNFFNDGYEIIANNGHFIEMRFNGATVTQLHFAVDINGDGLPNMIGKDVFPISLTKSKGVVNFWGNGNNRTTLLTDATYGCNRTSTPSAGWYCGALIQYDGWEIADDYPWN